MPHRIGAIAPRTTGGFVAAMKPGFALVDLETGACDVIASPESHLPDNRFNDGACDRFGRFWAGTMDDLEKTPSGALYCLDAQHGVTRFEAGFVITNGIRWSGDGSRMYMADSARRTILEYSVDPHTGVPGNSRVFAQLGEADGWPDGLCVDADDHIWGAHWGAGRITRYDPEGRKTLEIAIPAINVTSCCFGGEDFRTLYVTSARIGLDEAQLRASPLSGNVFAITGIGVSGLPSPRYAG
jgi:sugar lactone lactonase YvrE